MALSLNTNVNANELPAGAWCLQMLNNCRHNTYSDNHNRHDSSRHSYSRHSGSRSTSYGHKYYAELPVDTIHAGLQQAATDAKNAAQKLADVSKTVNAPLKGNLNDIAAQQNALARQAQTQANETKNILDMLRREGAPSTAIGASPRVQANVEKVAASTQQIKSQADALAAKAATVAQQAKSTPAVTEAAAKVQNVADTVTRAANDVSGKLQALKDTARGANASGLGNVGNVASGAAGLVGSIAAALGSARASLSGAPTGTNVLPHAGNANTFPPASLGNANTFPLTQVRVIDGGVEKTATPFPTGNANTASLTVKEEKALDKADAKVAEVRINAADELAKEQAAEQVDREKIYNAWVENKMPKAVALYKSKKEKSTLKDYAKLRKFCNWADHAARNRIPRHDFSRYFAWKHKNWDSDKAYNTNALYPDYVAWQNLPTEHQFEDFYCMNAAARWKNRKDSHKKRSGSHRAFKPLRYNADNYHGDKDFAKKFRSLDTHEYLKYKRWNDWNNYAENQAGVDVHDKHAYAAWKIANNKNYVATPAIKSEFDNFKRQEHTFELYKNFHDYDNWKRAVGDKDKKGCCDPCSSVTSCSAPSSCSINISCPSISSCSSVSCPSECSSIDCCPSISSCSSSTSTKCASSSVDSSTTCYDRRGPHGHGYDRDHENKRARGHRRHGSY